MRALSQPTGSAAIAIQTGTLSALNLFSGNNDLDVSGAISDSVASGASATFTVSPVDGVGDPVASNAYYNWCGAGPPCRTESLVCAGPGYQYRQEHSRPSGLTRGKRLPRSLRGPVGEDAPEMNREAPAFRRGESPPSWFRSLSEIRAELVGWTVGSFSEPSA